ncbi:hypothetical protein ACOSQ3_014747 [Xanthoceras sorbifolium]
MSVANNIKSTLPKTESAKEFMNFVDTLKRRSQTADKSLARTLIGTMHEHVIEMTNIAETRLKNQGTHSIHLVNDQGARKKTGRKHGKGK